jgi:type III secretory pathway component EscS
MWVVRELLRLFEKIAIAVVIAIVVAELRTLMAGGDRTHTFQISCLVVGAVLLLMATIGRNNNFERRMDYGITEKAWGRIPGVSTVRQARPEDPTLTPGAVFAGAGIVMLALGLLV